MKTQSLQDVRTRIDQLDVDIVQLLDERARLAAAVKQAKGTATAIYQPARETAVLHHIQQASDGSMPAPALDAIYKEIIASCRNLQQPLSVAYLGPEGTYTEDAARTTYGVSSQYESCATIDQAVQAVEAGRATIAVVPIENSLEGPVNQTLDALMHTSLKLCNEIVLPIRHQLLSHADDLQTITQVVAHPQALAQCADWLRTHLPHAEQIAQTSNAAGAQYAAQHPTTAAIASLRAATMYELPVQAQNIQDSATNTTRFVVLGATDAQPTGTDKTSLVCSVPNTPGSLGELLSIVSNAGINMTKLESRPARNKPWDYVFFIDIDGHQEDEVIAKTLPRLQEHATYLTILGSYPKAA